MKVSWNGEPSFLHVFIDTTNIVKLEQANNNIKLQKIMFTSVSHEFRNPLNAIINASKVVECFFDKIKNSPEKSYKQEIKMHADKIKKFISIGKTASELLLALVEDVLNLSKMQSNMFTISYTNFNIVEVVQEVAELFEMQCKQKKISLRTDIDEVLHNSHISSDRGRIKQVLINLISNSYKFTNHGSITIRVELFRDEAKPGIEVSVIDTGIGISDEDKPKLFTLFSMLKDTLRLNPNGCGIGLTVSNKYIEMLQGSFELESKLGSGTCMKFIIPTPITDMVNFEENKLENDNNSLEGLHSSINSLISKRVKSSCVEYPTRYELVDENNDKYRLVYGTEKKDCMSASKRLLWD